MLIKSSSLRKDDLPFDKKGKTVSVIAIKCDETTLKNLTNGRI
jgi:hypothetical protein